MTDYKYAQLIDLKMSLNGNFGRYIFKGNINISIDIFISMEKSLMY